MNRLNKRGFTLIELLGVVVILAILIGIATSSYSRYMLQSRNKAFKVSANSLEDAAKSAYTSCKNVVGKSKFCDDHGKLEKDVPERVTLGELIEYSFIDQIENPYTKEEMCDEQNSYVDVTLKDDDDMDYEFKACLVCGTNMSEGCND